MVASRAASAVRMVSRSLAGGVFAAALLAASVPARAQVPPVPQEPGIVVIGEGSVTEAPDYAQIRAGVTTRAQTAGAAAASNSSAMAAIAVALREAGIDAKDIQTARFSLQPVYVPHEPNTEPRLSGFNAVNELIVTVRKLDRLGDVLDRLVGAGANDISNIEFLHSDPTKALDQARRAAIADAQHKAELYAKASGLTLGRPSFITENTNEGPVMFAQATALRARTGVPVPVNAGEDTLRVLVTVGYEVAP